MGGLMKKYILALDEGTTSARAILFDKKVRAVAMSQHEIPQIYPHPGWVEQDPMDIYANQYASLIECIANLHGVAHQFIIADAHGGNLGKGRAKCSEDLGLQLAVGYALAYIVYTVGTLIVSPASLNIGAAIGGFLAVLTFIIFIIALVVNTNRKIKAENALGK